MRFSVQQKWLAWGNDFKIQDEHGHDRYFVDGHVMSIGSRFSLQDMVGREIALIKQRLLSWIPTFEIHRAGMGFATVRQRLFTFLSPKFDITLQSGEEILVVGDFWNHEFSFQRNGKTIGRVSKKWFTFADVFGVEVPNVEDELLILGSTIAISDINRKRRSE